MVKVDWLEAVLRNGPESRMVEVNGQYLFYFYRGESFLEKREDWEETIDVLNSSSRIYSKGLMFW